MVAQIDTLYVQTSLQKTLIRLLSYTFFEGRPLTTEGRWSNRIVLRFLKSQKKIPSFKTIDKPIFIIGIGRSGTTLLGNLLSIHPDVGFLNEPKALWHIIYPAEDLIGSYCRGPAKYRLTSQDVLENTRYNAHKLFSSYLTFTGTHRFVDKYPENVFRVSFVQSLFPDAKFIFLVRNGWDTSQSINGWSKRHSININTEKHDWWGVNNRKWNLLWDQVISTDRDFSNLISKKQEIENPLDMATLEWILAMKEGIAVMEKFPYSVYMLRYEDLLSFPHNSLKNLLNFCELDASSRLFKYAQQRLEVKTPRHTFSMHPYIFHHFEKMMLSLGYL